MKYPTSRMRRLRNNCWIGELVAETKLASSDLVMPLFVADQSELLGKVAKMPGIFRHDIDGILKEIDELLTLGVKAAALFPVTPLSKKDEIGTEATNYNNLLCTTLKAVKSRFGSEFGLIADVALDPYTTHGHDGILNERNEIDNDNTVKQLCKQALVQAAAGTDIIAPSDMMDGRIGAIRKALDDNGFEHVMILSYAAKYSSALYGPFRAAVDSSSNLGTSGKSSYQMDYRRGFGEAASEILLDIDEGADMIMIKPAGLYLDIISQAKAKINLPLFAYQVSGEYSMVKAASLAGLLDFDSVMLEMLTAIKRAGANAIITYAAKEIATRNESYRR